MPELNNICYRNASTIVMETGNNRGYILPDMKNAGQTIRDARELRKWSQKDLADLVGVSQPAIKKIEAGDTVQSKFLPKIAQVLALDLAHLDQSLSGPLVVPEVTLPAVADGYGPKDFEIFSAAEGGPGEIIRSPDAVDWWPRPLEVARVKGAYGLYIVGDSMIPEWEPGQVAVINPNLPYVAGKSYIFYAEEADGAVRATVKRLRRQTGDTWFVTQHNPPPGQKNDFTLSKNLWRVAHRIVGRQDPA